MTVNMIERTGRSLERRFSVRGTHENGSTILVLVSNVRLDVSSLTTLEIRNECIAKTNQDEIGHLVFVWRWIVERNSSEISAASDESKLIITKKRCPVDMDGYVIRFCRLLGTKSQSMAKRIAPMSATSAFSLFSTYSFYAVSRFVT